MIPFKNLGKGDHKIPLKKVEKQYSWTFPSNNLSTSPHSLESVGSARPRYRNCTVSDNLGTCADPACDSLIKINVYGKSYGLDTKQGVQCMRALEDMM